MTTKKTIVFNEDEHRILTKANVLLGEVCDHLTCCNCPFNSGENDCNLNTALTVMNTLQRGVSIE